MLRLFAVGLSCAPLVGCCCLPVTDVRRPQTFVLVDDANSVRSVRACTWADWGPPTPEECDGIAEGVPTDDGFDLEAWTKWPVVIGLEPPYWADVFVACGDDGPRGITVRNPLATARPGDVVHIVLDGPPTTIEAGFRDADDAALTEVATHLCAEASP
jgi:hypothetical protein